MSDVLGSLRVYIEGNNKDLLKKLRASESAMKNSRAVMLKVGSSMQTVGSAMTKGLTLPITATATALGLLSKKAVDFEKQMLDIRATRRALHVKVCDQCNSFWLSPDLSQPSPDLDVAAGWSTMYC